MDVSMLKRWWLAAFVGLAVAGVPALGQDKDKAPKAESITDRKVDDLVKDLVSGDDVRREIAEAELPRRGNEAVSPLVNCLQRADQPAVARASAARILRKLLVSKKAVADAEATKAIGAVYRDTSAPLEVRGEAALALGDLKVVDAVPELIEGLNDVMFKVSENSREALVRIGQSSVDAVIAAYKREMAAKEGKDGIIYRSLLILGDVGGEKARACLAEALKTKTGPRATAIRAHAARALGMTGDHLAIDPLIDAYQVEREFDVAQTIERSLEWLTEQHDIIPQPLRWKAWWEAHRDEILGNEDHKYDSIYLPKTGLKKGDPLQAPALQDDGKSPDDSKAPAQTPKK